MVTRIHGGRKGSFRIKDHWRQSGLSRVHLAGQMGITPEHVSKLVKHADTGIRIGTDRLHQFADIFGVTIDELRHPPHPRGSAGPLSMDDLVKDDPEDIKDGAFRMLEIYLAAARRRA